MWNKQRKKLGRWLKKVGQKITINSFSEKELRIALSNKNIYISSYQARERLRSKYGYNRSNILNALSVFIQKEGRIVRGGMKIGVVGTKRGVFMNIADLNLLERAGIEFPIVGQGQVGSSNLYQKVNIGLKEVEDKMLGAPYQKYPRSSNKEGVIIRRVTSRPIKFKHKRDTTTGRFVSRKKK